jgi:hypothetical protein
MWKYNGRTINERKSWVDDNGIQHPPNWHIWSPSDKAAAGLTEVVEETPPDSRLYTWTMDTNGKIDKTARNLDDVKANLKREVKDQQGALLTQTDWAIVRKADNGTAIPSNIKAWRDAIRTKATAMENAIDGAADTDAMSALFVSYTTNEDGSVTKSGILYDWPELES